MVLGGGWYSAYLEWGAYASADRLGVTHMPSVLNDWCSICIWKEGGSPSREQQGCGEWVWEIVRNCILSVLS